MGRDVFPQIRLLKALSNLNFNTSNDGAPTASLGNLSHCLTTRVLKKFFRMSSLNLPSFTLKPLPLVLSLQAPIESPLCILKGCNKVSLEPSLLQAEQPQLSQPFFTGESLGTSPDCHDFSNMVDSGLATTTTNSLRIPGCIFSNCALAFLIPSLHIRAVSLYFSRDTHPWFHCLCISILHFSLTRSFTLLSHASLLPSLPNFLHVGIESSCTLRKMSLKSWQLCSFPMFLKAVSQGHPDSTLHLAHFPQDCEFHQRIITAVQATTDLLILCSSMLVSNRSSNASPLVRL
ncbi:hypothetical protein QYF61_013453, partial [Mycteria americana]